MNFLKELENKFAELEASSSSTSVEETPSIETDPKPKQTFFEFARDELRKHGLNLYSDDEHNTWLVRYRGNKKGLNFEDQVVRYGRSLIADGTTHETLMVAPPKSWTYEDFRKEHPDVSQVQVEDFPSGPMINTFWHQNKWMKATRSYVGAKNNFRSEKTFEELFEEAFKNVTSLDFDQAGEHFDQNLTYSWVLQHPEFLDVVRVSEPVLYLVEVRDRQNAHQLTDLSTLETKFQEKGWKVKFPKRHNFQSWEDVDKFVEEQGSEEQGLVFRSHEKRSKVRNPGFICSRNLLGNHSKTLEIFTENRQNGTTQDFLGFFPEFGPDFHDLEDYVEKLASEVHNYYRAANTRPKENRIDFRKEIPKSLQTACFNIHQEYWASGDNVGSRQPVYLDTVRNYIDRMPHMDLANMICSRKEEQKNNSGKLDEIKKMRQATQTHRQQHTKKSHHDSGASVPVTKSDPKSYAGMTQKTTDSD